MLNPVDIIKLEKLDEVFLKVHCTISQAMELKEYLSCKAPNFWFHPKFKAGFWDGRISYFSIKDRLLPIGLLFKFISFCNKFDYKYEFQFDINSLSNKISKEELKYFIETILKGCYFKGTRKQIEPHDFQLEAIYKLLSNKRGVIECPTGSGKSLIIYLLIRFLLTMNLRTVIVVPTTSLVEQMYSDFKEYGWKDVQAKCDKLYANEKINFDKDVLITTWQSVYKKGETFFKRFGGFVIDEVHSAKSVSVQGVCKKCIGAEYRFGTTGTLPEEVTDKYNIYGYIGPCVFDQKSGDLIDKGILSKIMIANMLLRYPKQMIDDVKKMGYHDEVNTILEYENRNSVLDFIFDNTPNKQNSLILCKKIDHLKGVEEYLLNNLPDKFSVYTIWGEVKPKEREAIRQLMEKSGNLILLATFATMGTGINIKRLHQVVFYASYKSKIKVLQSLGRGLRKHKTKNKLILWDCIDDLRFKKKSGKFGENHVFKHFRDRLRYYDQQGFEYINKSFKI